MWKLHNDTIPMGNAGTPGLQPRFVAMRFSHFWRYEEKPKRQEISVSVSYEWVRSEFKEFYKQGIRHLVSQWKNCLANHGDY